MRSVLRLQSASAIRTFTTTTFRPYPSTSSSDGSPNKINKAASETTGGGLDDPSVSTDQTHPNQKSGGGGSQHPAKTPDVQQQPTRSTGIGSSDGNAPKKD